MWSVSKSWACRLFIWLDSWLPTQRMTVSKVNHKLDTFSVFIKLNNLPEERCWCQLLFSAFFTACVLDLFPPHGYGSWRRCKTKLWIHQRTGGAEMSPPHLARDPSGCSTSWRQVYHVHKMTDTGLIYTVFRWSEVFSVHIHISCGKDLNSGWWGFF